MVSDYFWDYLSAERAEALLSDIGTSGPGSYLLRQGGTGTNYVVSFIDPRGCVKHWILPSRRDHHLLRAHPELVGDPMAIFGHLQGLMGTMWCYPINRSEQPDWVEEENTDFKADCRVCGRMNTSK